MRQILTFSSLLCLSALSAQTVCDSILVDSVRYAPFGEGLHIGLFYSGSNYLGGPTVGVIDVNNDTLHQGELEFFAVFPGPSVHQAHFPPPASPFTGTVVLNFYNTEGPMQCDFALTKVDLCPPSDCRYAQVFAYQQGGNPVPTELEWSITDGTNTLGSGVLEMDGTPIAFVTEQLCLPPGAYTLHMAQPLAAGTVFQVGMTQSGFAYTDGVTVQMGPGGSVEVPIPYYLACVDGTQGLAPPGREAPSLMLDGRVLWIISNAPLGDLLLLDAMGRAVQRIRRAGQRAHMDLQGLASGAYFLSLGDGRPAQRIVVP